MLHVFVPDEDGDFYSELCEDDGLTRSFSDGACYRTAFRLTRRGAALSVSATVTGSGFVEFRRTALRLVLHGFSGGEVTLDGRSRRVVDGIVEIDNRGEDFSLSLSLDDGSDAEPRHQAESAGFRTVGSRRTDMDGRAVLGPRSDE